MSESIDLNKNAEKVSDEHLAQLQGLVNNINALQFEIGKVETKKHQLLHRLAAEQDGVADMQDILQETYGSFDVNLQDGTINRADD